jgi:hypothetical protein
VIPTMLSTQARCLPFRILCDFSSYSVVIVRSCE